MIDSHAHLADDAYDEDREEVLVRAREAGVEAIVVIGNDPDSSRRVLEVVADADPAAHPELHATVGISPHDVEEADDEALDAVEAMLDDPRVVAVGEIGIDHHYELPRRAQLALFERQIGWAVERDLPVVVHSREAEDTVVGALERIGAGEVRGVIHCFTESAAMADAVVELGLHVSFAGIVTFKNAEGLRRTAARVPLERTLIETDSPYLAPVPHRGRRNEPAFVVEVARTLADLHGRPVEEVLEVTATNTRNLFSLPRPAR